VQTLSVFVAKEISRGQEASKSCLMLTLTTEDFTDEELLAYRLHRLMMTIKAHFHIKDLNYFVVRELQDRGVFHYHIVFLDFDFMSQSWLHEVWVGRLKCTSLPVYKGIGYCLKYMQKGLGTLGVRFHASYSLLAAYRGGYLHLKKALLQDYYFLKWLNFMKHVLGADISFWWYNLRVHFWWNVARGMSLREASRVWPINANDYVG